MKVLWDQLDKIIYDDDCLVWLRRGKKFFLQSDLYPTKKLEIRAYGEGPRPEVILGPYQLLHKGAGPFIVDGVKITGSGCFLQTETAPLHVTCCEIDGQWNGIWPGGDNSTVINNTITSVRNNGVNVGREGFPSPSNVQVVGNYINAKGAQSDPISFHDGNPMARGGLVAFNYCVGGGDNGIGIEERWDGVIVAFNEIYEPSEIGIVFCGINCQAFGNVIVGAGHSALGTTEVAEGAGSIFCGNIAYDCGRTADCAGFGTSSVAPWEVYHNTFIAGPNTKVPRMVGLAAGATGTFANNLLVSAGPQRYVDAFGPTSINFLRNQYYGVQGMTGFQREGKPLTWAEWADSGCYGIDPGLVNYRPSKPVLGMKLDEILYDFEGHQINKGYIGAYAAIRPGLVSYRDILSLHKLEI